MVYIYEVIFLFFFDFVFFFVVREKCSFFFGKRKLYCYLVVNLIINKNFLVYNNKKFIIDMKILFFDMKIKYIILSIIYLEKRIF